MTTDPQDLTGTNPDFRNASSSRHFRFLFHGEVGTGKTFLSGHFPSPFILDFENKLTGLSQQNLLKPDGDVAYWTLDEGDKWEDVEFFTYLFLFDKRDKVAEFLSKNSRPGKQLVEYEGKKEYIDVDWGPRQASVGEWGIGNRETFVDDGLTQMHKIIMESAIRKHMDAPTRSETGGAARVVGDVTLPAPAAYGTRDAMIERRLRLFKSRVSQIHYVLTCHMALESVDELGGVRRLVPAMTGKALPPTLASYFDESYELKKQVTGTDKNKVSRYFIDTEGSSDRLTLRSSLGLKAGSPSEWKSIQDAIERIRK